jgi:CheY-like chemotaxis protein
MRYSHPTILVVDDDANDLLFIQAAFKFAGVTTKIHTVNGGQEAIDYLNGAPPYADRALHPSPDFILTDLNMPGVDGFAVLEFVKSNPDSAAIPTTVLSGSQDNDDIKKAYWLGANAYHVKPSTPLELRHLIKTLHSCWTLCEIPEKNLAGKQLPTESRHKLGARFSPRSIGSGQEGPVA